MQTTPILYRVIPGFVLVFYFLTVSLISISQSGFPVGSEPLPDYSPSTNLASLEKITPLRIGDKVPDISFQILNGSDKKIVHLSDFKDKLVILDFWATWCFACVSAFPKLDSLQGKFNDRLQIILVNSIGTGDKENIIINFFKKRRINGQPVRLTVAVMDSIANDNFPHRDIPHYVWITPDRRVRAITESKQVTAENIQAIFNNQPVNFAEKKDFFVETTLDLGQGSIPIDNCPPYYSNFLKGRLDEPGMLAITRQVKNKIKGGWDIRGIAMKNMPLLDMYKAAIYQKKGFNIRFTDNRMVLATKNIDQLVFDANRYNRDEWDKENLYSYDLVIPPAAADSLYDYIIAGLNRYSGFIGGIEKRKIDCLVLTRINKADKIATKGGHSTYRLEKEVTKKYVRNMAMSEFVLRLELTPEIKFPVIDETKYRGNIDLDLPVKLNDLAALRKTLQRYGLDLIRTQREIEVFVIRDKK